MKIHAIDWIDSIGMRLDWKSIEYNLNITEDRCCVWWSIQNRQESIQYLHFIFVRVYLNFLGKLFTKEINSVQWASQRDASYFNMPMILCSGNSTQFHDIGFFSTYFCVIVYYNEVGFLRIIPIMLLRVECGRKLYDRVIMEYSNEFLILRKHTFSFKLWKLGNETWTWAKLQVYVIWSFGNNRNCLNSGDDFFYRSPKTISLHNHECSIEH